MTYTTDKYNGDTMRVPLPTIDQRLQGARREILENREIKQTQEMDYRCSEGYLHKAQYGVSI